MGSLFSNIKIGAHSVLWTPDGGAQVDLGYTKTGSTISIKSNSKQRVVHEWGDTPFSIVGTGWNVSAKIILLETVIDTIATVLSSTKTTVAGPPDQVSVDIDPTPGAEFLFGQLVFHPKALASNDVTQDWTIHKFILMPESDIALVANDDMTVTLSGMAALSQNAANSKVKLLTFGDIATAVEFGP